MKQKRFLCMLSLLVMIIGAFSILTVASEAENIQTREIQFFSDSTDTRLVKVADLQDESIVCGWYSTLEEAFASVNSDESRYVVYYGTSDYTVENDIAVQGNIHFAIMGDFSIDGTFVVKNGGRLHCGGRGYAGAVTVESGGAFSEEPDFTVGTLKIYDGSAIFDNKLQVGNYEKIVIADGNKTIADLLWDDGMNAFRHRGRDGTWASGEWATAEELGGKTIENVSALEPPFSNGKIEVDVGFLDYEPGGNRVHLTAEKVDNFEYSGNTTYKWYLVQGDDETLLQEGENNRLEDLISKPGEYTYKCEIARCGYTKAVTKKVIVYKGVPTYNEVPEPRENLVYNETEQELAKGGTLSTDQKILYSLDGTNWSENIPKAANADTYTVYYKVDENEYYEGIPARHFDVTIAKQVLKDIVRNAIIKTYNGKTDLPNDFAISRFICADESEVVLYGPYWTGAYESATAGGGKKVTLTVYLGDAAENFAFEGGTDSRTFEVLGTINKRRAPIQKDGELTIVKQHEKDYTIDFSSLLGEISYGETYGKITYHDLFVDIYGYYDEWTEEATMDENGMLTLPIQSSNQIGDIAGVITVRVTTENCYNYYYDGVNITDKDITLTVSVKAINKIFASGTPTLNPKSITYGQKIGDISLSGSLVGDDGRTVKGTFAWRNPDAIPSAGNASGEWDFIPDADYYMYENGHGTVDFTVLPKDIGNAVITLGESHKYNGSEQTQTVVSVKLGEMTLSESDYDISGDKATDVKTDGSYVLTITGKGNFSGTKTAEWNIIQANPKESVSKKTTAKVLKGKTLADAKVSGGEFLAYDGITALDGTFAWIDDTKVINSSCTEQMTFTPNDKNYAPITFDVAVSIYSWGGGASYSSHIVNFETNGGSAVENQAVKWNDKVSRPIDPKKEGYEFGGWFVDKELRVAYDFDTKVMKNFTLYAAWIKVEADYNPFNDVDKDYWYYDDVIDAVKKGLFNGTGSNTFAPNAPITRGMFITVLYRADGEPEVNATLPFTDIAENSYYAKAVIWAQQNGIVFGVSETEFAPNKNITREQIAAIMFRYAKYKGYDVSVGESTNILSYTDAEDVSEYAAEAVQYVVGSGLMKGKTETTINPRDKATRAEIAAILNRFIDGNK